MINEPARRVALLSAPVLAGALLAATPPDAATSVPLSDCASTDNGRPVVSAVTIGRHDADVRDHAVSVPVSAVVDDTGGPGPASGIAHVFVNLTGPGNDRQLLGTNRHATLSRQPDGRTWSGSVLVPPGVRPGSWSAGLVAIDGDGAERDLDSTDLRALGTDPTVAVTSVPDVRRPALRSLTLSRRQVDTRTRTKKIRITVRATDAGAGVGSVNTQVFRTGAGTTRTKLHKVAGTPHSGTWRGHVVVPRWAGTGTWRLRVRLADRIQNRQKVTPGDLARRGLPSSIGVSSRTDRIPPTISLVRVTPDAVDATSADAYVRVSARVRDAGSGVRTVGTSAALIDGDYFPVTLHRVSGTRHDGRWTARVTVPRCQPDDEFALAGREQLPFGFWAMDRADRYRGQSPQAGSSVSAEFRDNKSPYASTALLSSTGQIEVTTAEPIVGNGSWDPLVADRDTGAEVAGVWTCTAEAVAPVGCSTDPLTRAAFTPAVPFSGSASFEVTLNREHTLHVVDLAGNPVLGTRTAVRVQR